MHVHRLQIIPIPIGRIIRRSLSSDPQSLHPFHSLDPFPIISHNRRRPLDEKSLFLHPRHHICEHQIIDVGQRESREADRGHDPPFDFCAGLVGWGSSGRREEGGDYEECANEAVDDGGCWASPGLEPGVCFPRFAFVRDESEIEEAASDEEAYYYYYGVRV